MYIASRHRNIHRNRDSYKMALHSIFETMAEEMTVDWRILSNDRIRNFHSITPSYHWTQNGSGSILTKLNGRGRGFDLPARANAYYIHRNFKTSLQHPTYYVVSIGNAGVLSSPLSSVNVKNAWSSTSKFSYAFVHHALPCTT